MKILNKSPQKYPNMHKPRDVCVTESKCADKQQEIGQNRSLSYTNLFWADSCDTFLSIQTEPGALHSSQFTDCDALLSHSFRILWLFSYF